MSARLAAVVLTAVTAAGVAGLTIPSSREAATETPPAAELGRMVERLEQTMPRGGSGRYQAPREGESKTLGEAFGVLRQGDVGQASRMVRRVGYEVRVVDGGEHTVMTEGPGQNRGWGLFAHRRDSSSGLVVQIVHPLADADTATVGLDVFRRARADSLFVAGAHRDAAEDGSADVAHARSSALTTVDAVSGEASDVVLQVHGFDERKREKGFEEAVLSSGTARPGELVERLARRLETAGVRVCLVQGDVCAKLAGRTNVQGRMARRRGARFVHLELARRIRRHPDRRAAVVAALAGELEPSAEVVNEGKR